MVKVLDNRLVDLDILPGAKPADLLGQAEQLQAAQPEKAEALRQLAQERASAIAAETSKQTGGILGGNSGGGGTGQQGGQGERQGQGQGQQGGFVGGAKKVGTELAGTAGGLGKGVGNTLGNTVYDLGSTVGGAVTGIGRTGQAAVGMGGEGNQPQSAALPPEQTGQGQDDEEKTEPEVRKPPKLEIRSHKPTEDT